jgi:SAM-dependent methyltransferase
MKPFSPACERNQQPILDVLLDYLGDAKTVFEVGAGTGQHAVFFAASMPWLEWIASDLAERHAGISAWIREAGLANLSGPVELDAGADQEWPVNGVDAVFTANTLHIMPWRIGAKMIARSADALKHGGLLFIYGPFNRAGSHVGRGNALFDAQLRAAGGGQGLRDIEIVEEQARVADLSALAVHEMPANNFVLVFRRV